MAASLQPIYNRLNGADSYHPFSADTFQDWATEAGDVVTLIRGEDEYAVPVHSAHLSWHGKPQMVMNGNGTKKREAIEKVSQKKYSRSSYRSSSLLTENVNKKASVYFRMTNPVLDSNLDVAEGDLWVQSNAIDSYTDAESFTWNELGEFAWMDYFGAKMYIRKDGAWKLIEDDQLSNYNYELTRITEYEVNLIRGDLSGLYSQFYIEKGQIRQIVNDDVNGLHSEINQTAGEIRLEVSNSIDELSGSIDVQADRISLVVEGTGANAHIKPAQIVAAINNGASSVLISADHIELDGETLANILTLTDNGYVYLHNSELEDPEIIHSLVFDDAGVNVSCEGNTYDAGDIVVDASVNNNVLTLHTLAGDEINFSKATTLTPSWSGSVLTMAAKQTNDDVETTVASKTLGFGGSYGAHDVELALTQNGYPSKNSSSQISVPIKVVQQQGGGATTDRYTTNLNYSIASLLTTGSYNTGGTKTPGSDYIGFSSVTFTIPNASGFTKNDANYNTANSNQVGSVSKSGLTANTYMYWTVGGKKYHIVVNA